MSEVNPSTDAERDLKTLKEVGLVFLPDYDRLKAVIEEMDMGPAVYAEFLRAEVDLKDQLSSWIEEGEPTTEIDVPSSDEWGYLITLQGHRLTIRRQWNFGDVAIQLPEGPEYEATFCYTPDDNTLWILADHSFLNKDSNMTNEANKPDLKLIDKAVEGLGLGKGSQLDQAIQQATKILENGGVPALANIYSAAEQDKKASAPDMTAQDAARVLTSAAAAQAQEDNAIWMDVLRGSQPPAELGALAMDAPEGYTYGTDVQVKTEANPTVGEDGILITDAAREKFSPETDDLDAQTREAAILAGLSSEEAARLGREGFQFRTASPQEISEALASAAYGTQADFRKIPDEILRPDVPEGQGVEAEGAGTETFRYPNYCARKAGEGDIDIVHLPVLQDFRVVGVEELVAFLWKHLDTREVATIGEMVMLLDEHIHGHRTLTETVVRDIAEMVNLDMFERMLGAWRIYSVPFVGDGHVVFRVCHNDDATREKDGYWKPGLDFKFSQAGPKRLRAPVFSKSTAMMGVYSNPSLAPADQVLVTILGAEHEVRLTYNHFISTFGAAAIRGYSKVMREELQKVIDDVCPDKEQIGEIAYVLTTDAMRHDEQIRKPYKHLVIETQVRKRVPANERALVHGVGVRANLILNEGRWAVSHASDHGGPWREDEGRGMFHQTTHDTVGGFASPMRDERYGHHAESIRRQRYDEAAGAETTHRAQAELAHASRRGPRRAAYGARLADFPHLAKLEAKKHKSESVSITTNNYDLFAYFLSGVSQLRLANPEGYNAFLALMQHYVKLSQQSDGFKVSFAGEINDGSYAGGAPSMALFPSNDLRLQVRINGDLAARYEDTILTA